MFIWSHKRNTCWRKVRKHAEAPDDDGIENSVTAWTDLSGGSVLRATRDTDLLRILLNDDGSMKWTIVLHAEYSVYIAKRFHETHLSLPKRNDTISLQYSIALTLKRFATGLRRVNRNAVAIIRTIAVSNNDKKLTGRSIDPNVTSLYFATPYAFNAAEYRFNCVNNNVER